METIYDDTDLDTDNKHRSYPLESRTEEHDLIPVAPLYIAPNLLYFATIIHQSTRLLPQVHFAAVCQAGQKKRINKYSSPKRSVLQT